MEVYEEEGPQPEVYEEVVPPQVDINQRNTDALDEASLAASRGESYEEKFQQVSQDPVYRPLDGFERAEKYTPIYMQDVEKSITAKQELGEEVDRQAVVDNVTSYQEGSMGAWEGYRSQVDLHPQAEYLDDVQKNKIATISYLQDKSSQVFDEMGWTDWAEEIGTMVVSPDMENLRMSEVADLVGMDFTLKDGINYVDFLGRLSAHIKELPPKESVETIDTIIEGWEDILGNNRFSLGVLLKNLTGDYNHDTEKMMIGLGTLDQALSTTIIGTAAGRIIKSVNAINKASKMNNVQALSEIVKKGVKFELVPNGVDAEDAAGTIMPLSTINTLSPGANNRLAPQIVKEQSKVDIHLAEVDRLNSFGVGLTPKEQDIAVARKIKQMEEEEGLLGVSEVSRTDKGVTVKYRTGAGEKEQVREAVYTLDDVGNFSSDGVKGYRLYDFKITSANFRFWEDRKFLVQLPEQMQFQAAKIRESYDKAIKGALGSLNRTSFSKVDQLLTQGDEAAETYSRQDLTSGVTGIRYTEAEADAYAGIRQVVDHMYHSKNKQILDSWKASGIKVTEWAGQTQPMKRYGDVQSALTGFKQAKTRTHMIGINQGDGKFDRFIFDGPNDMDDEWLKAKYAEGYELSRVTNGRLLDMGDTKAEWALVKKGDFREPSGMVLGRREGYMPKIRKNGHFFVKRMTETSIGGKMVSGVPNTIRYFDNHADAKKWIERQDDADDLKILADGEMSAAAREDEYTNISGGLFTGARKQTEIPFGLEEQVRTGERADALHGLQRYVNHLAKQMPYNLYRMGLRQRWEKTARDLGALDKRAVGAFDELVEQLDRKHPSYGFLNDGHNQVSLISGVPTAEEKAARAASGAMAMWLERFGPFGKKLAAKVHGKDMASEISGVMRGATFHTLLGMYNPAQYLIQASGALIAFSINPVHATKAIGQSMAFQVLDRMVARNPRKMDDYLKWMEARGIDTEGYKLWNKSGLKQSITSANVDYEGLWADLPYDAGLFRRVMANDTFFFKSGELVSARVSFATAYNRWKTLHKGKEVTDSDLPDILARTEQYRLNMSRANSAKFQSGMLSVPTQFQQVNTKFMEKLFGRGELTAAEKIRMASGQAAFFGAMGVPIVGYITPVLMDHLGLNAETLNEEELTLVRNGALTWLFNDYMDINSVISGRMTLGGDFVEKVFNAAVEPTRAIEVLAGPSYSIMEKSMNGIWNVRTALSADFSAEGLDVNKVAVVTEVLAKSLAQFAGPVANSLKAYDMTHSKFYKNRAGRPIFEWTDLNAQTILFQALGFSPTEVADYYEINNRNGGMIPTGMANLDAKRITFIMNMLDGSDDEDSTQAMLWAINTIKSKYKPEDQVKLIKQVTNLIKHPEDVWEDNTRKLLEGWTSELSDGFGSMVRLSKAKTNPRVARELDERGIKE
jgi:hypothetical protein